MHDQVSREQVFKVVKENILVILPDLSDDSIREDVSLRDLGANSLDRADVVTGSMEALRLTFPVRELADVQNIGGLVEALHKKLP